MNSVTRDGGYESFTPQTCLIFSDPVFQGKAHPQQ
jgi:hypothetical protein